MRLSSEFVRLPFRFDVEALAAEVLAVPEADWQPHPQGFPGNSALPLVASTGDPRNEATRGEMLPTPVLARLPYLRQVLAAFAAPVGRSRLMRLEGDAEATLHVDVNYYWLQRVRIHVPIVTQPGVRFQTGLVETFMAPGETWIFDTWRPHNVINPPDVQRIHLVVDTVGSARFWEAVAAGEAVRETSILPPSDAPVIGWDPSADPDLPFETVNHPVVMSPWELRHLSALLLEKVHESSDDDAVRRVHDSLESLARDWTALWALHADRPSGHEAYRARAEQTRAETASLTQRIQLLNMQDPVAILQSSILGVAVNPGLAKAPAAAEPAAPAPEPAAAVVPAVTPRPAKPSRPGSRLTRPVFIVSAPRSGSTLLFETLAQAPGLWTIGDESHEVIEGIPALHPAQHDWESNRLTAADADDKTVTWLEQRFVEKLRDRGGRRLADDGSSVVMLEKTPKNSLRVPFLAEAFPDARFIYLYRDPVDTLNSMIEAWRAKRFITYPDLPGWNAEQPWSLLLVPGWRDLIGLPIPAVVAEQWRRAVDVLLDDLEALPPEQWCVASYGRLVKEPQQELERLCAFLEIPWDRTLTAPLPPSRFTLTRPEPGKWRRNEAELTAVLPIVAQVSERARTVFGDEPPRSRAAAVGAAVPVAAKRPAPVAVTPSPAVAGFTSSHTASFPELLGHIKSTLLVSTYQSGRLIAFREDDGVLNTHFRAFESPMGIAFDNGRLALGTRRQIWEYRDQPAVTKRLVPEGKYDGCFLPRKTHYTGDIRVHELGYVGDELWFISTLFSCLATLDADHSFVPRWRPSFVTALSPDDRCHLNGFTIIDGAVRYVSALGETDDGEGWRDNKANGGIVIDVASGEIVTRGLSMPHSPRWYDGSLWILESGKGSLGRIDLATGAVETVAEVPGFARGLTFAGRYAFIGLSQTRESVFHGLPIMDRPERASGVWVVDITTGKTVAFLKFDGIVQEIFDVQLLPGYRYPEIGEPESDLVTSSFVLPDAALADVPERVRATT
ncbi:MAG: hypothetical protein JWP11_2437 [Frankiales bacterium]|nr:hypothetical protein [Frankiales bacterium]